MNKRLFIVSLGCGLILILACILFYESGKPVLKNEGEGVLMTTARSEKTGDVPNSDGNMEKSVSVVRIKNLHPEKGKSKESPVSVYDTDNASEYPTDINEIKKQIYEINVEYTEDIEILDDITQKTDKSPSELWTGEWVSVDDWKRHDDGFRIEENEDGTFAFFPDDKSDKAYEYDEETGEFNHELDYYGKIITSKARFINENVLVMMKISGRKVALDIYQKE